jgi:nicotinate-nucleotide pyrophosphorylase (carboxylating)
MRHVALEQPPFEPLAEATALVFRDVVQSALNEDGAANDLTTRQLVSADASAAAALNFRSPGVIAGLPIAALAFTLVDPAVRCDLLAQDGTRVNQDSVVANISGPARGMLTGERVALNFLSRLSGIATLTHAFVAAVAGLPVRIVDTRKTTPGLRALERYAVRAGGGFNHRFGLADAILIKDNHLAAAGSIGAAVRQARERTDPALIVEVECETIAQVQEALDSGVEAILLDNMSLDDLREAVKLAHGRAILEASGGVMLGNVREIAQTGVDLISVGALTHGARSLDVGLDFVSRLSASAVTVE